MTHSFEELLEIFQGSEETLAEALNEYMKKNNICVLDKQFATDLIQIKTAILSAHLATVLASFPVDKAEIFLALFLQNVQRYLQECREFKDVLKLVHTMLYKDKQ